MTDDIYRTVYKYVSIPEDEEASGMLFSDAGSSDCC